MQGAVLPETAAVPWRPRADAARLRRRGHLWTLTTVAHVVPFLLAGAALLWLQPLSAPVAILCIVHAWVIPELYAARGANVVRRRTPLDPASERTALGLLGDLVGHDERALHGRTGLVLEPGRLGTWLVGEAGALLVRPGGRRVDCWCVHVDDPALPAGDRIAHLLLALRADEEGVATVANLTFSGGRRRVRRRLERTMRPALDAAGKRPAPSGAAGGILGHMQRAENTGPSFLSRVVAVVVLAIAAWLLLKFAIGFVAWLATVVVVIVAAIAVIWALRVLL